MEERPGTVQGKSLDSPDETREFVGKGKVDIVHLGNVSVGKFVLEPGWRRSEHVKPIVGTESCEVRHSGYVLSGRMKVLMDDGTEAEASEEDAAVIPPRHDAWIEGDEPCVWLEFAGQTVTPPAARKVDRAMALDYRSSCDGPGVLVQRYRSLAW
jgi:quercetin dioxygenase-like cupin family protein